MSSSFHTFSSSFYNVGTHPNVYHRKVLIEKIIKGHTETSDEEIPVKKGGFWTVDSELSSNWANYEFKLDYVDFITETKPHLKVSEPVRKATVKRPPDLMKKFGSSYSNRGYNQGFKSRQFSRKAF